jgi:hypothetical protein
MNFTKFLYYCQKPELIGTNRYKIGKTDKMGIRRYSNSARLISFFECNDTKYWEKCLIKRCKNDSRLYL